MAKTVGIIAEYNPFHNGHLYHLKKIKEKYKDSPIILVMTGNFTERGDVAIIDKWKRTEIALSSGADLVIELPFPFATQSADYFSYGAITLLEQSVEMFYIFIAHFRSHRLYRLIGFPKQCLCLLHPFFLYNLLEGCPCSLLDIFGKIRFGKSKFFCQDWIT